MSDLSFSFLERPLGIVLVSLYVAFIIYICYWLFKQDSFIDLFFGNSNRTSKIKDNEKEAFELLKRGYDQNTLNEKAIRLIYNQFLSNLNLYNYSFVGFLEAFLIYIRKEDSDGNVTKNIEELVNPLLDKERAEKPYSGINEGERRILLAIEEAASQNELTSLKRHITDLSVVIENNQEALKKAEATNKWTIPTSIIGVILTLVFGIYGFWGPSISSKEIDRISEKVSQHVTSSVDSISNQQIISNLNSIDSLCSEKNK